VLSVDIGGSSAKFLASGHTKVRSLRTGRTTTPGQLVNAIKKRADEWSYSVVALGYPGLVSASGPVTEPANLGRGWVGFDFEAAFGCPVRIVNDATMQALGSYDGGRMLFLGFGTGVGSVLIVDHAVVPLELGELQWKGKKLYEQLGRRGFDRMGSKRWRDLVIDIIPSLQRAFLADYIVIGGGNSKFVEEPLPPNVRIGHNLTAFRGGYRLWDIDMPVAQQSIAGTKARSVGDWRVM
jgi:predicted NBD/HSP70 family sugar kinase